MNDVQSILKPDVLVRRYEDSIICTMKSLDHNIKSPRYNARKVNGARERSERIVKVDWHPHE